MLQSHVMRGVAALGVAVLIMAGTAWAQEKGMGPSPFDSIERLEKTAKVLFKIADTNNDSQISQKEAIDAGNLIVGGFFFRADINGDGIVTPEEARQAREALFSQQPLLRYIVEKARWSQQQEQAAGNVTPTESRRPINALAKMMDANNDQKLQASEVRQGVQTSVQNLFALADTNRDGQLTPTELNDATNVVIRSGVQAAFQGADTDRNGVLSLAEFDKAISGPAHAVFRIFDANNDNQLSMDELQRAQTLLADQLRRLRIPEAPNSLRRRLESELTPTSAPTGTVVPSPGQPIPTPTPAPAPAPR